MRTPSATQEAMERSWCHADRDSPVVSVQSSSTKTALPLAYRELMGPGACNWRRVGAKRLVLAPEARDGGHTSRGGKVAELRAELEELLGSAHSGAGLKVRTEAGTPRRAIGEDAPGQGTAVERADVAPIAGERVFAPEIPSLVAAPPAHSGQPGRALIEHVVALARAANQKPTPASAEIRLPESLLGGGLVTVTAFGKRRVGVRIRTGLRVDDHGILLLQSLARELHRSGLELVRLDTE